jgi:hypothetical protein
MVPRLLIEDCARLDIKRLFKSGRVGAGSTGTWRGQRWRIDGSFLVISDKSWKLISTQQKNVEGTSWVFQSLRDVRRYRHLLMTPDGRVGTRGELEGIRYRSHAMWRSRPALRRRKVIEKLVGRADLCWVRDHPIYVPDRPKWMKRAKYRRLRRRLMLTKKGHLELEELPKLLGQNNPSQAFAGHPTAVGKQEHILIAASVRSARPDSPQGREN